MLAQPPAAAVDNYDVVVYGGTAGGVTAAIEAARLGKSVAIIEPSQHLGGMTTGGLSATDYGNKLAIRGLARDFYTRVGQAYSQGTTYYFEPKVGESVIDQLVASLPNITVLKGERLNLNAGVTKTGSAISSIHMESGRTFTGGVFIDASYEGDLMAKSGVSYIVGRESSSTYNEPQAGVFVNTQTLNVDPYVVPGNPASGVLPMLTNQLPPANGTADDKVQAYNFRLTVTKNANRLPWTAPPNYDPAQYELLKRAIQATNPTMAIQVLQLVALGTPNGANKYDVNANGNLTMVSTDYVGFSKTYPDADYATRQQLITAHRNYEQGYLYFLATDPSVPLALRTDMNTYGLAPDEFTDNGNWPTQLYVREARRMIGTYVMTEANDLSQRIAADPIALGSYTIDSHGTSFFVDANGKPHAEGNIGVTTPQPYGIAYSSLTPQESQASNLLVSSAISASRVGYGSIRMEPQYMMMGQAAGAAAALALNGGTTVQQVNYSALRDQLLADGARLTWPMSLVGTARTDFNDIPGTLPRSIQFQNSGTSFFGPWDFTTTQNVVAGNLTTSAGGYNRPQAGANAGKLFGTFNAFRQSGCPLDAPMSGTVWFSVLVDNTDATGAAGISFNPTAFGDTTNNIQLIGTTLSVTLSNTTTNNVATLPLNSVHLLLGKLTITAGNDTLSLWADPASLSSLSAPIFTSSSANFLSSLASMGIISYNSTKSNAGGYIDALIVSNGPTAFIDVTGATIAGDFNRDGIVDAADYVTWRKGLGTSYTDIDYNTWRINFGRTAGNGAASAIANVPEPAALVMTIAGLVSLRCCRQSRTNMSSTNNRPKISMKFGLSAWLRKMALPLIFVVQIAVGGTHFNLFAANTSVRKTGHTISSEADDQTFSPTAKISASVGKGGKNQKQDVLLVKRLLSKFGYNLVQNGEANAALNSAIGKFQSIYAPAAKADQRIDPAGQTWNALIGIGRVKASLDELAKNYDLEPAVILAIQSVESGNNGYLPDGRPKILFEGHVFWRMLKTAGKNPTDYVKGNEDILFEKQDRSKYLGGAAEYVRLEKAGKLDRVAALKSASWGEFQIMGFNHKAVGYPDVDAFVESMKQPGAGQIRAVLAFMDNKKLLPLVRGPNKNWAKFAAAYNGAGYKKNQYDVKLQKAYDRFSRISKKETTQLN